MDSCLSCARYFSCKDENKSAAWICDKYQAQVDAHIDDLKEQTVIAIKDITHEIQEAPQIALPDDLTGDDLYESVLAAIRSNSLTPIDLDVDDSHLWEAPNYYEWCLSGKGIKFKPFARQMWIALQLFGEMCPNCSDPLWYADPTNIPVDYNSRDFPEHVQLMEHGVCPNCGHGKHQFVKDGSMRNTMELSACLGQRSGKSILTGSLASYHIHKLLKLVRPAEYYGLASSTTLTGTYVGLTLGRAFNLLWRPVYNTIMDSPWFKEYIHFMQDEGKRLGTELITVKDTYINFRRSNMLISPAAPDSGKLRGDTRIQAAIDELGFFRFGSGSEDLVTINADEIHASLTNSLATVRTKATRMLKGGFDNVQQGLMINISSPSSVFDKIMTLVRQSEGSKTMLGVHLPSWEVNPDLTEEDLAHYKITLGLERFERDFGANPPLGDGVFFDPETIPPLFKGRPNAVVYEPISRINKKGRTEKAVKLVSTKPLANQPPSLLAIDAGETNNSFSLVIGVPSLTGKELPNTYIKNTVKNKYLKVSPLNTDLEHRVTIQAVIEVIPPENGKVNFSRMFKHVITPLLEPFNVKAVVADRWNSVLLLDELRENYDVDTFQYSLRYKDMELIRNMVETENFLSLPRLEAKALMDVQNFQQRNYPHCFENRPLDHLGLQFLTVKDYGRTVGKGSGMTDDSFRALALACFFLGNVQFVCDYLLGAAKKRGNAGIGAIASGSSNQTTVASSTNAQTGIAAIGTGSSSITVFGRK